MYFCKRSKSKRRKSLKWIIIFRIFLCILWVSRTLSTSTCYHFFVAFSCHRLKNVLLIWFRKVKSLKVNLQENSKTCPITGGLALWTCVYWPETAVNKGKNSRSILFWPWKKRRLETEKFEMVNFLNFLCILWIPRTLSTSTRHHFCVAFPCHIVRDAAFLNAVNFLFLKSLTIYSFHSILKSLV